MAINNVNPSTELDALRKKVAEQDKALKSAQATAAQQLATLNKQKTDLEKENNQVKDEKDKLQKAVNEISLKKTKEAAKQEKKDAKDLKKAEQSLGSDTSQLIAALKLLQTAGIIPSTSHKDTEKSGELVLKLNKDERMINEAYAKEPRKPIRWSKNLDKNKVGGTTLSKDGQTFSFSLNHLDIKEVKKALDKWKAEKNNENATEAQVRAKVKALEATYRGLTFVPNSLYGWFMYSLHSEVIPNEEGEIVDYTIQSHFPNERKQDKWIKRAEEMTKSDEMNALELYEIIK